MDLKSESKTMFIPLLGKATMSKQNLFLKDSKAEEIVSQVQYDFKSLKQSQWLSMFLSLRASILDEICNQYIKRYPHLTIVHLGCGLDSRCLRVLQNYDYWYDVDYSSVIHIRKEYYQEDSKYKMIGSSITESDWLSLIPNQEHVLFVAEGLTMYLSESELQNLVDHIYRRFKKAHLLFDAYSKMAVKASKIKNPVNQMNATVKFGMDKPDDFTSLNKHLKHLKTHYIVNKNNSLRGWKRVLFNHLYCGKISQSLYKIYEFGFSEEENYER